MIEFCLAVLLTGLAIVGFGFNVYIVLALLVAGQISKPNTIFLFHLGAFNSALSLLFLAFSSPSLFRSSIVTDVANATSAAAAAASDQEGSSGGPSCLFQGFLTTLLQPLVVWNLAGVHLDRFILIAYPLRYNSLISLRKSVALISLSWFVSLSISVTCLASLPPLAFRPEFGACLPVFRHNAVFPVAYYSLGFLLPICIVIAFNLKIVSIAKYHQYRIGNALLGMAIESTTSASEVNRYIRERARVSEQQKMQLKRFEGKNAIATLSQSVGTLVVFYSTFACVGLYEAFASKAVPPVVMRACVVLLLASPVVNGFIFGLKNKEIRTPLINFARKEIAKSEMHQEIRLRSPGHSAAAASAAAMGSSSQTSMGNLVGHLAHFPYLKRQLSQTCISVPNPALLHQYRSRSTMCVRRPSLLPVEDGVLGTPGAKGGDVIEGDTGKGTSENCANDPTTTRRHPPPMLRHASDLTWRMGTAAAGSMVFAPSVAAAAKQFSESGNSGTPRIEVGGAATTPVVGREPSVSSRCSSRVSRFLSVEEEEEDEDEEEEDEGDDLVADGGEVEPLRRLRENFDYEEFDSARDGEIGCENRKRRKSSASQQKRFSFSIKQWPFGSGDSSASISSESEICFGGPRVGSRRHSLASCVSCGSPGIALCGCNDDPLSRDASIKSLKTKRVTTAIKALWQHSQRRSSTSSTGPPNPKITITLAPNVDQSSLMDFNVESPSFAVDPDPSEGTGDDKHNASEKDADPIQRRDRSLGCVRAGDIVVHIVGASDDASSPAQVRKMENTVTEEETPFICLP